MQIKKESYCNSFDKGCCEEIKNVKKEVLYDIEQKKNAAGSDVWYVCKQN